MPLITMGNLARPTGLISSESFSDGHPDKLSDQISDAVLDAALVREPHAHVTAEAAAKGSAS